MLRENKKVASNIEPKQATNQNQGQYDNSTDSEMTHFVIEKNDLKLLLNDYGINELDELQHLHNLLCLGLGITDKCDFDDLYSVVYNACTILSSWASTYTETRENRLSYINAMLSK